MFYQEKKTLVSIITEILLLVAYLIYASNKFSSNMDNLKLWATTMLVFIGIGILASIIIQIVFHILLSISIAVKTQIEKGKCDDLEIEKRVELEIIEDEMDKLIESKAMRFGFVTTSIGFLLALVSLVLNYPPVVMINILFCFFCLSAIISGISQLYLYRRGV